MIITLVDVEKLKIDDSHLLINITSKYMSFNFTYVVCLISMFTQKLSYIL
jgi:hypothetical protein